LYQRNQVHHYKKTQLQVGTTTENRIKLITKTKELYNFEFVLHKNAHNVSVYSTLKSEVGLTGKACFCQTIDGKFNRSELVSKSRANCW